MCLSVLISLLRGKHVEKLLQILAHLSRFLERTFLEKFEWSEQFQQGKILKIVVHVSY